MGRGRTVVLLLAFFGFVFFGAFKGAAEHFADFLRGLRVGFGLLARFGLGLFFGLGVIVGVVLGGLGILRRLGVVVGRLRILIFGLVLLLVLLGRVFGKEFFDAKEVVKGLLLERRAVGVGF